MTLRFAARFCGLLLAAPLLLASCEDDKVEPTPSAARPMYVVNQGNFTRANAEVTRFDRGTGAAVRAQFAAANPGLTLGDVAQSMAVRDGKGYLVVNNSNKIVVVNMTDFKQVGEIAGLAQPRYLAFYLGKGYVTEWVAFGGAGRVSEIDLTTNTLTGRTWPTGAQPEEILATTTGLLVANSGAAFLTAFSPLATTTTSVPTLADGPTNLRLGAGGRLWVLCAGRIAYTPTFDVDTAASTPGALVAMPVSSLATPSVRVFGRRGVSPGNLALTADGSRLYYTYLGHVFGMGAADAALPRTALIRRKSGFGALGVDPADGTLYAADQRGYTTDGRVLRYQSTGAVIDSFNTAVGPTQFVF
jgi:hypothetical protein